MDPRNPELTPEQKRLLSKAAKNPETNDPKYIELRNWFAKIGITVSYFNGYIMIKLTDAERILGVLKGPEENVVQRKEGTFLRVLGGGDGKNS